MCLMVGGAELTIGVAGAAYVFEMNERCGPMPSTDGVGPKHRSLAWLIPNRKAVLNTLALRDPKRYRSPELMYRTNQNDPWTCLPCELKKRAIR